MTKKYHVMILIIFIFLFQVNFLYAQSSYKSDLVKALSSNDFVKIEQIILDNAVHLSDSDKRLMYSLVLDYSQKSSTLNILQLLQNQNIFPSQFDLFNAINRNHSDEVIQFILDKKIIPNGEILLFAAEKNRFNLVNQFAQMGTDTNYQYPSGKPYSNGMTALLYAVQESDFETIKLLLEKGANVNLSNFNGYAPAALAKEMDLIEIYDYLVAHGADEVEVPPIADEVSQTNTNQISSENTGQGIGSLIDSKEFALKSGTYRLARSSTEIILPNSSMGAFTYTNNGIPSMGGFRIDKNSIIITMQSRTYSYTIDSDSSFSGFGERWVRIEN
jgi:hypothetical protein